MSCTGDYCHWMEDGEGGRVGKTYSVSLQPTAPHCWLLRTHEGAGGTYESLDPWVSATTLRAERWVWDEDVGAMRRTDQTRPYGHLFGTTGDYPASAHRAIYALLATTGFAFAYHERVWSVGGVKGLRVIVTDLRTGKKKVTFVPLENKREAFPPGYFDPVRTG